jgi:hypothetical protein
MISLYYCTSLWQMLLFDCLNNVRSILCTDENSTVKRSSSKPMIEGSHPHWPIDGYNLSPAQTLRLHSPHSPIQTATTPFAHRTTHAKDMQHQTTSPGYHDENIHALSRLLHIACRWNATPCRSRDPWTRVQRSPISSTCCCGSRWNQPSFV